MYVTTLYLQNVFFSKGNSSPKIFNQRFIPNGICLGLPQFGSSIKGDVGINIENCGWGSAGWYF